MDRHENILHTGTKENQGILQSCFRQTKGATMDGVAVLARFQRLPFSKGSSLHLHVQLKFLLRTEKKRQMENEDDKQHLLLNELHDSTALQFNQVNQSHQGSSKRLECSITRYRTFNPQNFSTQLETKNSIFDDAIYGEYSDLITAPLNANRKLH